MIERYRQDYCQILPAKLSQKELNLKEIIFFRAKNKVAKDELEVSEAHLVCFAVGSYFPLSHSMTDRCRETRRLISSQFKQRIKSLGGLGKFVFTFTLNKAPLLYYQFNRKKFVSFWDSRTI